MEEKTTFEKIMSVIGLYCNSIFHNRSNISSDGENYEAVRDVIGAIRVMGYKVAYNPFDLRYGKDSDFKTMLVAIFDGDTHLTNIRIKVIKEEFRYTSYSMRISEIPLPKENQ